MKASVVDLRYKMNEVLKALDRNEKVEVLYRGKIKGVISPTKNKASMSAKKHPLFGSLSKDSTVEQIMNQLRGQRHAF